jgi:hypothetical protein
MSSSDDAELEALLMSGSWKFLPDDHPHVIALRKKFNAAMDAIDARGPQTIVLGIEEESPEELIREFDEAMASGEKVTVTAPPPGWTGPIRVPHPTTVTWRHVSQRALIPWDEPLWLALTPRQKMDGDYYPVVLGYFDGDSFAEYDGLSLDGEVTHWAAPETPRHPTRPL